MLGLYGAIDLANVRLQCIESCTWYLDERNADDWVHLLSFVWTTRANNGYGANRGFFQGKCM